VRGLALLSLFTVRHGAAAPEEYVLAGQKTPDFVRSFETYGAAGLRVFGINVDDDSARA
jgi:hypothetical protein